MIFSYLIWFRSIICKDDDNIHSKRFHYANLVFSYKLLENHNTIWLSSQNRLRQRTTWEEYRSRTVYSCRKWIVCHSKSKIFLHDIYIYLKSSYHKSDVLGPSFSGISIFHFSIFWTFLCAFWVIFDSRFQFLHCFFFFPFFLPSDFFIFIHFFNYTAMWL